MDILLHHHSADVRFDRLWPKCIFSDSDPLPVQGAAAANLSCACSMAPSIMLHDVTGMWSVARNGLRSQENGRVQSVRRVRSFARALVVCSVLVGSDG